MPKRRRLQSGLSSAATGLSDIMAMLLQGRMVDSRMAKTQEAIDTRSAASAEAVSRRGLLSSTMADVDKLATPDNVGKYGPQMARTQFANLRRRLPEDMQGGLPEPDFESLDTPYPMRMANLTKELEGVTSADDPRLTAEGLRKKAPGFRVEPDVKAPIYMGGLGGGSISEGNFGEDPAFTELTQLAEKMKTGLLAKEQPTGRSRIRPDGTQETVYERPRDMVSGTVEQTGQSPAQKAAEAGDITEAQEGAKEKVTRLNFGAALEREKTRFKELTPLAADRAAKESWARVPAEMELLSKRQAAELAKAGLGTQAEEVSRRNISIRNLLPIYKRYRELAVEVASSGTGAGSPVAGATVNAIGKVPVVGELLTSGLEAAHVGVTNLVSGDLSGKVAELNKLGDTLAQGMANSVLGNRGQTTENDRRTAKQILSSSFTDIETVKKLLTITDKMLTILPVMTATQLAQDPMATPAQILEAARKAAETESNLSPAAATALEIFNAR